MILGLVATDDAADRVCGNVSFVKSGSPNLKSLSQLKFSVTIFGKVLFMKSICVIEKGCFVFVKRSFLSPNLPESNSTRVVAMRPG
jgi:hypothetical protein